MIYFFLFQFTHFIGRYKDKNGSLNFKNAFNIFRTIASLLERIVFSKMVNMPQKTQTIRLQQLKTFNKTSHLYLNKITFQYN